VTGPTPPQRNLEAVSLDVRTRAVALIYVPIGQLTNGFVRLVHARHRRSILDARRPDQRRDPASTLRQE